MTPPWRMRGRPPWWPENQAWPPSGMEWHGRRRRFVHRAALVFAILLFSSVAGATSLISLLFDRAGVATGTAAAMVAFVAVVMFVVLFAGGMRRFGMPLGDVVDAAD